MHQITMSSDGNASLPVFDHLGKLIDLQVGQVCSLHQAMVDAVKQFDVSIEDALTSITLSPASILQLKAKGCIAAGLDADINLLNAHTLVIEAVYSKGERVYCDGVSQLKIPF